MSVPAAPAPPRIDRRHRKSMSASDATHESMTDTELTRRYISAEAGPSVPRSRHSRHPTASDLGSMSEVETYRQDHVSRMPRSSSRRTLSAEQSSAAKGEKRNVSLSDVQGWVIQALTAKAQAHSSLHPDDELAAATAPELNVILGLLQGLCLLSSACQLACAEEWVMEMLIDLLLLLRAVRRTPSLPSASDKKERPIALDILELLFCILVDSPEHTRTFERLGGLEATTRVLKGTGVDKEVKMRCLEFLYFYLLPEQTAPGDDPALRSASGSSAATASTDPYPPSPVSAASRIEDSRDLGRLASAVGIDDPSSAFLAASRTSSQPAFVPQTPKKKSTPALGFMTPSANHLRRPSGSLPNRSITPTLETVPPSPDVFVAADPGRSKEVGTPMKRGGSSAGLKSSSGIQRSSTMVDLTSPRDGERRVTAIHQKRVSEVSKPGTPARRSMPPPVSPSKFLQPSDAPPVPSTPRRSSGESSGTPRRSTTMQSLDAAARDAMPPPPRPPSATRDLFKVPATPRSTPSAENNPGTPKSSKAPRTRHSLAPSHTYTSLSTLDAPPLPSRTPGSSRASAEVSRGERTPSRMKRSETGLSAVAPRIPPSPSMNAVGLGRGLPLSSARRVVSRSTSREGAEQKQKELDKGVKSVQQKKDMLSSWIGNVDELVQSIEQVKPGRV